MVKNYVLDTNVLLLDPNAISNFDDNTIIIPIGVIEELDKFKKDQSELGKNARHVSRVLDDLRKKGDLREGVQNKNGLLKVIYDKVQNTFYKESNVDLHVLQTAQEVQKNDTGTETIVISRDINVRIRANALGIKAESYESDKITHKDTSDKGYKEIFVDEEIFNIFAEDKIVSVSKLADEYDFYPNNYLCIKCENSGKTLLGRVDKYCNNIKKLIGCSSLGIEPKNREQGFALDALLDESIKLVCISGMAGTGKTLLCSAVGYYLAIEQKKYKRLLVSRPVFPMGKDIGFLPGSISEKLDPWMQPIYDSFDVIIKNNNVHGRDLVDGVNVVIEPLTYIRGRSIRDQFLIIDESQNLNTHEIKTIITRAGENTKVVLTGDVFQIDNPYLDSLSNGLSVVMRNMRDSKLSANIVLEKGVRSELAEEAAKKL